MSNRKIKQRIINRKTNQHGIQLTYKQFLEKLSDIVDDFYENYIFTAAPTALPILDQQLQDFAYAYNIKQFPIWKDDEKHPHWIIGFLPCGYVAYSGALVINFELTDNEPPSFVKTIITILCQ